MLLFVGLGNPGPEHAHNRHNFGYMAVDEIVRRHNFSSPRKRFQGLTSEGRLDGERVMVLKPTTYMNESGRSVGEAMRFYKLSTDEVIVFHDEVDLAPGKIRVKSGGGSAGHNGIRSLDRHIGNDYRRVRLGVGHPGGKHKVAKYTLSDFAKSDAEWVEDLIDAMADAAPLLAAGDDPGFATKVALLRRLPPPKPPEKPTSDQDRPA